MPSDSTLSASLRAGPRPSGSDLRAIWIRLCLFFAPALLIIGIPVYLIDPYGLFSQVPVAADRQRLDAAEGVNQVLLGIVSYAKHPTRNILLGDSQMNHFKVEQIEALTDGQYTNLSYGGGTLGEAIATFWYAAGTASLQKVYFGMSYYSFTDNSLDRVGAAVRIVKDPLMYFLSGDVLEAAWADAAARFLHHTVNYKPTANVSIFWQQQLGELVRRKQTYSASEKTVADLREIVRYCRDHGIGIFFVIPPEHEDAHTRLQQLGMNDQYSAFKATVAALGSTYDCDIPNDFTRDASNFLDPFHTTVAAASTIAKNIWADQHELCDFRPAG
jgi:hypothetical protein